jgi:AraC-like DNA-binding protein
MEKRLHQAMHLLTNLKKTVSEASFEAGFENSSHFSRAFRQYFGFSPANARLQTAV